MARKKQRRTKGVSVLEPEAPWWARLSPIVQHAVCIGLLVILGVSFFSPVLFTGQSLIGGDTVQWRAMAESMIEYREATGEEPLWAPNGFAGMPGYMISYPDQVPQADTIATALRGFMWPASHFLFLLVGVYLLVVFLTGQRRDFATGNKLAGVLAAVAYGLTTYIPIILVAGHNTKFIALAFAPWLLLAFAYALRRPGLLAALFFAIVLAVNIRADHIQITYYASFLIGVWWLVEGVGAYRNGRLKRFGQCTAWLALGSILGLLMVAQPMLSHLEYRDYTIRGAAPGGEEDGLAWDYAMSWSQGVGELLTLLIADAYGGGGQTYWGPKPFTEGPHYIGGIALLLAGLAIWAGFFWRRQRRSNTQPGNVTLDRHLRQNAIWGMSIGALLMVLFSLGENFPVLNRLMFDYFPLFDAFRVPETWLSIVALAIAVLAGIGLHAVTPLQRRPEAERSATTAVYIAVGSAIALMLVLIVGRGAFFDFERPGEREQIMRQIVQQYDIAPDDPRVAQTADRVLEEAREERDAAYMVDSVRTLIFLILAGIALVAYRRGLVPAQFIALALIFLLVTDLWGVDRRYFNEERLVEADGPADLINTYEFDRFLIERREEAGGPGHFRILSFEASPMNNARPAYHHETIGGYHGAKLRLYQDYIDHIFIDPDTGLPADNALDLLNTRYLVAPQELPGTETVFEDEQTGMLVLERPETPPRAWFVSQTEVVSSTEELWSRLRDEVDLHQTALLSEELPFETTPVEEGSQAEATLEEHTPREITWRVSTDAPRLLVVSEVYYPAGWTATLDGEEVPIYRVNHLLRGVQVPEGEYTLTMRFEPASHYTGVWIAAISTILVYGAALFLLVQMVRRRRKMEPAVETPAAQ